MLKISDEEFHPVLEIEKQRRLREFARLRFPWSSSRARPSRAAHSASREAQSLSRQPFPFSSFRHAHELVSYVTKDCFALNFTCAFANFKNLAITIKALSGARAYPGHRTDAVRVHKPQVQVSVANSFAIAASQSWALPASASAPRGVNRHAASSFVAMSASVKRMNW